MKILPEHQFILDQISIIGDRFSQLPPSPSDALMQCIRGFIDRLYLTLGNVYLLISKNQNHSEIIFPLSLMLRTTMVDAFLVTELFHTAQKCSVDMNFAPLIEQCLGYLSEGLSYTKGYLERVKNVDNSFDLDKNLNTLIDDIKALYKENNIEFTLAKNTNISSMLKSSEKYADYHRHFDVFYTIFSKIEHFGLIYFNWLNYPINKKEESIYKAIKVCMIHYYNILSLLFVSRDYNDFAIERISAFKDFVNNQHT